MKRVIDQKHRERAQSDLDSNYLLDAGAGTGKTTVLVSRIMSIVREGKVRLDRVAAITFTEKAAGELKFRLRAELDKAIKKAGENGESGTSIKYLRDALSDLESASIGTIHSFAASLLRERPAEAGVDPRFEVLDEFDAQLLQEELWEEWLEREMLEPPPVIRDALSLGLGLESLKALADKLAEHRDLAQNITPPGKYPDPEELKPSLSPILATLDGLTGACKNKSDSLIKDFEALSRFVSGFDPKSNPIKTALYTGAFSIKPKGAKTNWNSESARDEAKNALDSAAELIGDFHSRIVSVVAEGLLYWLKGFVNHYESRKTERGALDFQDLLLKARNLLKNDRNVRKYFQDRYRRLLVDEFQDTDPLQVEIVFYLVEAGQKAKRWEDCVPEPGKLFIVGDPKQSIYAFRRADLQMYSGVERVLQGHGEKAPLIQNFRTVKSIVQWVNEKFSTLFGDAGGDYGPAYGPIEADRADPDEKIKTGVWKLPVPGLDYEAEKKPPAPEARELEARTIAAFLKDVIRKWKVYDKESREWRPLESGDVALLFMTRTGIERYEKALRAQEIPYVAPGGSAFYKTVEVLAALDCLKAIDRPDDPVALLGALRSPFFGFSDEEIFLARHHGLELDYTHPIPDHPDTGQFKDAFDLLNDLHTKRNMGRMAALIEKFYLRTLGPALFMLKPSGEQRLANLLKVIERARRFESAGPMTFGAFVEHLSQAEDVRGEEEAPVVEGGDRFVRLMSIHGAKGLEFPMVIIANMTLSRKNRNDPVCHRRTGRIEFDLNGIQTGRWEEAKAEWDNILAGEATRMLYVACTRARDYLVLPVPGKGLPDKGYTLPLLEKTLSPVNVFNSDKLVIEEPDEKPFRFRGTRKEGPASDKELKAFLAWREERKRAINSLSRRKRFRSVTELVKKESGDTLLSGESAAMRFGSFVHDLMNEIDFDDPRNIEDIARSLAADESMNDSEIAEAVAMALRAMNSPVWKRARMAERRVKEYPLVLSNPDGIISGRPDLVFVEGGEIVIADYKTDNVRSREEAEKKIKDAYRVQGEHYAHALKKITGLPVKETVFLFLKPDPPIEISGP